MASGSTSVYGLIGYPVRQSLSPILHNAAFRALGLDAVYVTFPVPPEDLASAIAGVRALGVAGINVTIPHKERVIEYLDDLAPEAHRIGSVNTVRREGDRLVGYSTDGYGFGQALLEAGFNPAGRNALICGAGGAARAVAAWLLGTEAARVAVAGRTPARVEQLEADLASLAGGRLSGLPWVREDLNRALAATDLVVNATPIGMGPETGLTLPLDFPPGETGRLAYDLIYHPNPTGFMRQAAEQGWSTAGGLGMLIHQAARAFTLWTGYPVPVAVMRDAIRGGGER